MPKAKGLDDTTQADAEIVAHGWTVGKVLGEGAFGKVKFVTRASDGQQAACKIIAKPTDLKKMKLIDMEYKIMKNMDHPYIVKCFDAYDTDKHVFLFLELMEGGELFDEIVKMGKFTEGMAASLTYHCLQALNYMHSKGIIHRDLKPENMLLAKKGDHRAVKLTDFGLSKMLDEQSSIMKTPCGTPGYVAPEVISKPAGGYSKAVDVWSMGVITYILLCGFPPFYADNDAQLFAKIKKAEYKFLRPYWDPISEDAKKFIRSMLVVNVADRATIDELLLHPWLAKVAQEDRASREQESSRASQEESDLKANASYNLKQTEEALALQVKRINVTMNVNKAKRSFMKLLSSSTRRSDPDKSSTRRTDQSGGSGERASIIPEEVGAEASATTPTTPASAEPGKAAARKAKLAQAAEKEEARRTALTAGDERSAEHIDVQVQSDVGAKGAGCNCVLM